MLFLRMGAQAGAVALFGMLFVACAFAFGLLSLISGPIASEAAPQGRMGSVIGTVAAVAEIFGGGVAPALGGWIAGRFGVGQVLWLALAGLGAGLVVSLFLVETAPHLRGASPGRVL